MANSHPSSLTLYIDHMLLAEGKGSTTIPWWRDLDGINLIYNTNNKGGNPEYLNQ